MKKNIIVTTTINAPTIALNAYAKMPGWDLIVVGDKKTPHDLYKDRDDLYYFSPEEQDEKYPELSEIIGWNKIARRSLGYILAYDMGCEIMATVDDDNIPLPNWGTTVVAGKTIDYTVFKTNEKFFDPLFAQGNYPQLWHRGFPYELLPNRKFEVIKKETAEVHVQAGFWNGDPDIDAIARIAHMPDCKFDEFEPFSTKELTPFNSQNTIITREFIKWYFMFPWIGRMEDIWAAYVLQQLAKEHGKELNIVFTAASVFQDRNEHNLITDLKAEIIGYDNSIKFGDKPFTEIMHKECLVAFNAYTKLFNE